MVLNFPDRYNIPQIKLPVRPFPAKQCTEITFYESMSKNSTDLKIVSKNVNIGHG